MAADKYKVIDAKSTKELDEQIKIMQKLGYKLASNLVTFREGQYEKLVIIMQKEGYM